MRSQYEDGALLLSHKVGLNDELVSIVDSITINSTNLVENKPTNLCVDIKVSCAKAPLMNWNFILWAVHHCTQQSD